MKKSILYILLFIFSFVTLASAQIQTGVLKGKVIDRKTKEPIIGATVTIVGTYFGVSTDINGNFQINTIKPGDYTVKAIYLGYKELQYNGVKINATVPTQLNLSLTEVTTDIGAVEVLGQRTIIDLESGKSSSKVTSEDIKDMSVKDVQ